MKKMMSFAMVCIFSGSAFAYTLKDLAGKYRVTMPESGVINTLTLTANGQITLFEKSPEGTMDCAGKVKLKKDIVSSNMICKNGFSFYQTVDFSKVGNLDSFTAPVFSSLFEATIPMNFEKLK